MNDYVEKIEKQNEKLREELGRCQEELDASIKISNFTKDVLRRLSKYRNEIRKGTYPADDELLVKDILQLFYTDAHEMFSDKEWMDLLMPEREDD